MIGIDIVEVERIRTLVDEYGDKFLKRLFTDREILYCNFSTRLRYQRFAVRFAAKEALIKAIGEKAFAWTDVEIIKDDAGRPDFELYGKAALYASQQGIVDIYVSLSHTRSMAAAMVYLVGSDDQYYEDGDVQVFFKEQDEGEDEGEEEGENP